MQTFDWTPILTAVIGLIGAGLAFLWKRYIQPWLQAKGLNEAAKIVVYAVEVLLGRYTGAEKWALAVEKMRERGFKVDSDIVKDAIRAAWEQLNLEQIVAKVKKVAENKPPQEDGIPAVEITKNVEG